MMSKLVLCIFIFCFALAINAKHPNIIFILTDDQDIEIGGLTPIVKTKKLIGDAGVTFTNMFVTSPLCCPSRSSILTGKYVHNHGALNNSLDGNCSSSSWQKDEETKAFATVLKQHGYDTFYAGKYLNQYGDKQVGGAAHIPPGWDHWYGLIQNSKYYNYSVSDNGKEVKHGDDYKSDYFTDRIGDKAMGFLKGRTRLDMKPFFMMLATPACHAPFTPAPQYADNFTNVTAPRTGSFGVYGKDKHWLMRQVKHPMSQTELTYIDDTYRNRWRTLLSVDDIVENVVNTLDKKDILKDTYIVYSSDNGFHLGQFSLPNDKRQLYEFDIRVPLMVRGPGVTPGVVRQEPILNIDLAPTFIDIAGGETPSNMDGESFKSLLENQTKEGAAWRSDFAVEHSGEWGTSTGCKQWDNQRMSNCFPDCVCEDSYNNTYACVRMLVGSQNLMYCEFSDSEQFVELYDLHKDPHELENIAKTADPNLLVKLNKRLTTLTVCSGDSCRAPADPWYNVIGNDVALNSQSKAQQSIERFLQQLEIWKSM